MHNDQRARGSVHKAAASSGDPTPFAARRTDDHQLGRLLDGRYRIGSRIARGGMASVYEAVDVRLDRTVAVKIMHPGLGDATTQGDESFARRFVREAKAAARLSHPNVVAVYDQGEDDGTVYLVMEYVPGHTLRDTIAKEAPMSPERALAILDPILSALASAHRAGLVHRDVKPENVLIADDGRIKVADFGLAKAVSADTQHTATNGVLIGTVSYLAPELVVEQRADARADVYAAGVILYELLTGQKPHTGETPIAVAYRHVHHDVPAPSLLAPTLPAYVDALVARATTRDTSLRPSDAGVLLHHVHRVSQALHEGLREDPELVDDLLPAARAFEAHDAPASAADRSDTTPEPMGPSWFLERDEPTSVIGTTDRPERAAPPTPPRPTETDHDPHGRPPRRRRGVVLLVALALLVAAISAGGYWLGWGRYTTAPSVVGLTQAAAEQRLSDAGLELEIGDQVHSESIPKGEIVATDPRPGARILPGDTVTATVSLGPERYDVPDLRGMTLAEAEAALGEVKMVVGRVSQKWSEKVPKGSVIASVPAFGTEQARALPVDTAVRLVVSKGRKPIKVRSFVGKDADAAEEALEKKGLVVEVVETAFSDTVDEGDVISQDPETGTLHKGDTVKLVVSKGPELVAVPSVRYLETDEAVEKLEDAGFEVKKERAAIYLSGNVAWETRPGAGTKVKKGSTVVLLVV